jgi:putative transport protein
MELITNPVFALFVIISIGFILGNINIKGFSFDVSAVLFVALAFGHFGIIVPQVIERIGMVLFIFTVGIQAGPGFMSSFKKQGRKLAVMATLIVLIGVLLALAAMHIFKIDSALMVGILCGALTSTPGLTVAIDATSSPLASIGYGIAYPVGVIGVIIFVRLLPRLLKIDLAKENKRVEQAERSAFPSISYAHFVVENESVTGKSLNEINLRSMTGATVSRVQHNESCFTPLYNTKLSKGDVIRAVGSEQALTKVEVLVGSRVNKQVPLGKDYTVEQLLVTNKELIGKTLDELSLHHNFDAVVTRIRRSGIDIAPSPDLHVRFSDKLTVACPKESVSGLGSLLGNDEKLLSDTDFLPIALGIVIGILIGYVELSFSGRFSLGLGLSGGVLIAALVLSGIGRTGPIVWTMSGSANQLLRQMGLLFFLAAVGTKAGEHLMETITESGVTLLLIGLTITILPMAIALALNKFFFKFNLFELLGAITGGMTSTPGLAACDTLTTSNTPGRAYASVYPIAMVVLIIFVQILVRIVS